MDAQQQTNTGNSKNKKKNLEIDTTLSIKACIFTSSEIGKMEQHAKLFKNPRLFYI